MTSSLSTRASITTTTSRASSSRSCRYLLRIASWGWGPDLALVYGDTNSTLAGALAAAQLQVPVAHVEAGMRSGDWSMPEELNRVLTDHASELLFCSTPVAVANLEREGVHGRVELVG